MLPNLKKLRQEVGISQQRLAEAIGVSQQSINQYENHAIEPDIAVLCRMADFFDTSIDFIVGHTGLRGRIEDMKSFSLNQNEAEVITQYRSLKNSEKQCIRMMLATLKEKEK